VDVGVYIVRKRTLTDAPDSHEDDTSPQKHAHGI